MSVGRMGVSELLNSAEIKFNSGEGILAEGPAALL